MRIDCHIHGANIYKDIERIKETCGQRKIDALVCTDHVKIIDIANKTIDIDKWFIPYCSLKENIKDILILLGAEVNINNNDYLLYGLEKKEMIELYKSGVKDFYNFKKIISSFSGLVFQAHPCRIKHENYKHLINLNVDGFEVKNGHVRHGTDIQNTQTESIANTFNKLKIGGSDAHRSKNIGTAFIEVSGFDVKTEKDLVKCLRSRT